jgi:hypothetical protein
VPIGAPGRPQTHPVDDRIVGVDRCQGRAGDDGQIEVGCASGDSRRGRRACPGIEADLDHVDPPVKDLGERDRSRSECPARVVGRESKFDEQLGERTAGRAALRRRAQQYLAGTRRDVAEIGQMLAHPTGQDHGEVAATAARCRHESGQFTECPPLVGGRRIVRADQDARDIGIEQHRGHRQWVDRFGTPADGPPAAPRGGRDEWPERPLRGGHDGHRPRRVARDLESRQVVRAADPQVEGRGERPVCGHGAVTEDRDDRLDIGSGRHRQRTDEAPAPSDTPDQGGGRRRGARIEGEEGSGFARHPPMLPGSAAGRCRAGR